MIRRVLVGGVALVLSLSLSAEVGRAPTTNTVHVDCTNVTGTEDGTEDHPYDTIQEGIDVPADGHTISASYSDSTTSAPTCTLTLDCATEGWEFKINGTTRPCGWSGMFNCGEVVELEAVSLVICVRLCRWEVNGVAIGANPIFITMDSDKIAVPVFGASYPVVCTVAVFPDAPNCGDLVAVDTTVTTDSCGNPLTCTIDWADGSASECSENTHTYRAPGLYEVTATFTDDLWGHTAGVCGTTVTVSAHTIHVDCANTTGVEDGTPEHPYNTIQEGIVAASDGDIVLVRPCTYYENVDFLGKAITVASPDPLDPLVVADTVIDGAGAGSVVYFVSGEGQDSVLTGFTIANGGAQTGGGISCYSSSPTIANNHITRNSAGAEGGGIHCANYSSPTIVNNRISGNSAGGYEHYGYGGAIDVGYYCSPTITNNTITGNSAHRGGGGIAIDYHSSGTIAGNTIADNTAGDHGGGIACYSDSSPTMTNNMITGNSAGSVGGGIWCYSQSSPVVVHCTIADNVAVSGCGIYCDSNEGFGPCSPRVTNSILWNDVALEEGSSLMVTYSDTLDPWPGEGNIGGDPQFVDAANADYHLLPTSPCIDAGWNDATGVPETDMDGDPRPWPADGIVDMGADEWVPSPIRLQLRGNCWHLITIPCHPVDPDPWELFDELRQPNRPGDWLSGCLYRYDPAAMGYVMYQHSAPGEFGPITAGVGYWLWLYDDETICYEAECSGGSESVDFANAGWHLMGSPQPCHTYVEEPSWYRETAGPYPFSTLTSPGDLLWLQDPLYGWSPLAGGYVSCGLRPEEDDHLRAFKAYWLYTFVDDLTVEVPPP